MPRNKILEEFEPAVPTMFKILITSLQSSPTMESTRRSWCIKQLTKANKPLMDTNYACSQNYCLKPTYIQTYIHTYIHTHIYTYIHTYIHYITLHYITLYYTILHYTTLYYIILHSTTLYFIKLYYLTLHYITLY